ncbi:ethionine resistance protein [Coemansia sp. RSA 1939]|nr:ethionine resistance protein [Coemansia sp. RSA 1939]
MATTSKADQGGVQEISERCDNSETTPLLRASLSELDLTISKNDTRETCIEVAKAEFKWMASSSTLTILTLLLEFSFYTADVMIVGHLGAKELGAMSLAVTLQVILALAPTFGLVSAMDTFCSTAFTASRDKTLVGFHFQRGLIAVCAHSVLVAPILWNAEAILLFLRQDAEIARLAGLYLRIQIINTLPFGLFEATKRYLQAQGIMKAGTIITAIVAPVHWIGCYMLVRSPRFGIGYAGAPIVNILSNCVLLVGIVVYTCNSRAAETWGGWKRSAFCNMWAFYKLAIPAVVTICADWFSFELLSLGASYFGADQLAGNAIVVNTIIIIYHLSNGIGFGVSPRIGNLIGGAKPRQARIAAKVALLTAALIGALSSLGLSFCGDWWMSMYTGDPAVIRAASQLLPVACVLILGDGLNSVLAAILRGLGRQQVSANAYLFGLYAFALPVAMYMGYVRHLETYGLWWGTCAGVLAITVVQTVYILAFVDWKDEVRICLLRLKDADGDGAEAFGAGEQ